MAEGSNSSLNNNVQSVSTGPIQWAPFCCKNVLYLNIHHRCLQFAFPSVLLFPFSLTLLLIASPFDYDLTFQSSPFQRRSSIVQKVRRLSQAIPLGSALRSFPTEEPSAIGDAGKENITTETLPVVSMQIGKIKEQLQDLMKTYSITGVCTAVYRYALRAMLTTLGSFQ